MTPSLALVLLLAVSASASPHHLSKRQANNGNGVGNGNANNPINRVCDWFNLNLPGCNTRNGQPPTTVAPTARNSMEESAACGLVLGQVRSSMEQQLQQERAETRKKLEEVQRLMTQALTSPTATEMVRNFCGTMQPVQSTPEPECELGPWSKWAGPVGFSAEIERTRQVVREGCGCPDITELREVVNLSPYLNDSTYANPNVTGETFSDQFLNKTQPRDILFILDSSGSILTQDFERMREGLLDMMSMFCGGVGAQAANNHIAIMLFSTNVSVLHRFSDSQDPNVIRQKLRTMVHTKGNTCTGDALLLAANTMFAGARPGVPRDVLLITDGQSNCGVNLQMAAQRLSLEASVYCLGVGLAGNDDAKREVASIVSGNDKHIFSISKFIDFQQMLSFVKTNVQSQNNPCQPIVTDKKK